jgi:methyltransferase (TIGR00027 family)
MMLCDLACRLMEPEQRLSRSSHLPSEHLPTERPSRTAQTAALNRALGTLSPEVPGFCDPLAVEFLREKWRKKVVSAKASIEKTPGKSPYPSWLRGMGVFNQFRTLIFDRAIASAMPVAQLVILGAGLDTRAWRLDGLEDTLVFEVDRPGTQAWKRDRAAALKHRAKDVRFVSTDFRQNMLAPLLQSAGFDPGKPTFWLWEGVTMYLTEDAVSANLGALAALSPPGSHLAFTYLQKSGGRVPRSLFLALLGEPVRSAYSPEEISDLARTPGWYRTSDSSIEDWLRTMTPGLNLTRRQVGLHWLESIWIGTRG